MRGRNLFCEGDKIRMSLHHMGERTGFVEGDVTVLADTAEKELDTAVRLDGSLVCVAFSDKVGCIAVEDMYLGRGYVDWKSCEGEGVDDERGTDYVKRTRGT